MRHAILLTAVLLLAAGTAMAANELIVSEIMYNSTEDTDVEWIELFNNTTGTLDLTGWYVIDDNASHSHVPLSGTMAPHTVMVLAGDEAMFTAKYPTVTNYFPVFFQTYGGTWNLGNGGDALNVYNASNELVFSVTYDDAAPWPTSPDGGGPSLLVGNLSCTNFSDGTCWTAGQLNGTPGVADAPVAVEESSWGNIKSLYR